MSIFGWTKTNPHSCLLVKPKMEPPVAPQRNDDYNDEDYQLAEFEDLNDGDMIYVRWSVQHQRAYMYSTLDRPTQWVYDWTIRKTVEVGMGQNLRARGGFDAYDIEGSFVTDHRELPDEDGNPTIVALDADYEHDDVEKILDHKIESYAANKIMFMFSVR